MNKKLEFKSGVRNFLECLNKDIENVLSKLIEYNYPSEVAEIKFEIFMDGFSEEFPVRAFFMDSNNTEFFTYKDGKAEYPSPVTPDLLNIPYVYPQEFEDKYIDLDEDFESWQYATEVLVDWFSEKWLNAGGKNFQLRATIAPHDSTYVFNLITSEWQKN